MNSMWLDSLLSVSGFSLDLFVLLQSLLSSTLILLFLLSTSPFLASNPSFLIKGSNSGSLPPCSNWVFEPYCWESWWIMLGFKFLWTGSNLHFEAPAKCCQIWTLWLHLHFQTKSIWHNKKIAPGYLFLINFFKNLTLLFCDAGYNNNLNKSHTALKWVLCEPLFFNFKR